MISNMMTRRLSAPLALVLALSLAGCGVFGGKGKISDLMGDVAKGIKSFKKGMAEDEDKPQQPAVETPRTIDQGAAQPVASAPQAAPQGPPKTAATMPTMTNEKSVAISRTVRSLSQ